MDLYSHVRVLFSIILGLGVSHILRGVARIVQHPKAQRCADRATSQGAACVLDPPGLGALSLSHSFLAPRGLPVAKMSLSEAPAVFSTGRAVGWPSAYHPSLAVLLLRATN